MKTNSFQLARPIYFKIPSKKWALCKFKLIDILFLLKWKRKKKQYGNLNPQMYFSFTRSPDLK